MVCFTSGEKYLFFLSGMLAGLITLIFYVVIFRFIYQSMVYDKTGKLIARRR